GTGTGRFLVSPLVSVGSLLFGASLSAIIVNRRRRVRRKGRERRAATGSCVRAAPWLRLPNAIRDRIPKDAENHVPPNGPDDDRTACAPPVPRRRRSRRRSRCRRDGAAPAWTRPGSPVWASGTTARWSACPGRAIGGGAPRWRGCWSGSPIARPPGRAPERRPRCSGARALRPAGPCPAASRRGRRRQPARARLAAAMASFLRLVSPRRRLVVGRDDAGHE